MGIEKQPTEDVDDRLAIIIGFGGSMSPDIWPDETAVSSAVVVGMFQRLHARRMADIEQDVSRIRRPDQVDPTSSATPSEL